VMSKQYRMMVLAAGAWMTFWLRGRYGGLSVLDWTCWVIIVGCVETIVVRLGRMLRELESDPARHEAPHPGPLPQAGARVGEIRSGALAGEGETPRAEREKEGAS
jgi:hypothetical protein